MLTAPSPRTWSGLAEIWRFGLVGGLTFGVNFLVFSLCFGVLKLDYRVAATVAYVVTVLCHFVLNKYFTFAANSQKLTRNAPRYVAMLLLNYLITLLASWLTVEVLHLSAYFAVVASTLGTAVSSFTLMKHFVFNSVPASGLGQGAK